MACVGQSILKAHVTGACLLASKSGYLPVADPSDVDCGCISALVIASNAPGNTAFRRASLSQYAAKGLTFAGRPLDAIPLAARAVAFFEAASGAYSLGLLCAKADLALAFGCSGRAHWRRAAELWETLRADLEPLASRSSGACTLLRQIETDKFIAIASMCDDKALRASALRKAFASGSRIQHPFLMRIVVELELLGETTISV
jgi:hypothetical protein